jgi:DNA-binding CsgD family transcriptional regulator
LVYLRCMEYSRKNQLEDWYYTAYSNRFDPYIDLKQFDSCKVIADDLYKEGLKSNDLFALGAASFMYGRTALRKNEYGAAIEWLTKSKNYYDRTGVKVDLYKVYKDLAKAYEFAGPPEKALEYYKIYKRIQDSMDNADKITNANYLLAKAGFEKEQLNFKLQDNKKQRGIKYRNIAIVLILAVAGIVFFLLNKKRKKARQEKEEAEQQLGLFSKNIIAKDQQIEALKNALVQQQSNVNTAAEIATLSEQMILTDADWQKFQTLFEKAYPGFLYKLKTKASGITEAEVRMACLIKIKLTTKQIAAMQGISPDSVHKTRQRLRQRFDTPNTAELEALITSI